MKSKNATTLGPPYGSLIIHGGGSINCCAKTFVELAGGPGVPMVYIPTAFSDDELEQNNFHLNPTFAAQRFGFKEAKVLHTRDPKEADREDFVKPIMEASGVWLTGGRQWRLADSYLHTRTHRELKKLLDRGGVIAGSSAGATIQGSYLVRGDTRSNTVMKGDHQEGFGFISNIAIDQHHLVRNRQFDLLEVLRQHPELLGIGIDVETSIVVMGNEFEVIGRSYVAIYDGTFWSEEKNMISELPPGSNKFYLLGKGRRYNLEMRKVIQ